MKLYRISQTENDGYDTYDSAIVAAVDEDDAAHIAPCEFGGTYGAWCSCPDKVTVEHIGEAAPGIERGVVLASFNAG